MFEDAGLQEAEKLPSVLSGAQTPISATELELGEYPDSDDDLDELSCILDDIISSRADNRLNLYVTSVRAVKLTKALQVPHQPDLSLAWIFQTIMK